MFKSVKAVIMGAALAMAGQDVPHSLSLINPFKPVPPKSNKIRNKPTRMIDVAKWYRRRKMAKLSRRANRK
jgi:hypothetical protein